MSAQHPPGVDGQAPFYPTAPAPDYSRRFVLNLAGSATSLGISTVAHTVAAPSMPTGSGEQSAAPTLIWMIGSVGWLAVTVGWIALRELCYGFNRVFPRVVINQHHHYHLPDPGSVAADGKRRTKPAKR